jgi:hypothetical protein
MIEEDGASATVPLVSTVQEIESAIVRLGHAEREAIRDWLDELVEENLEVSDAFRAKIARARDEIARGEVSRIRPPGAVGSSARPRRSTRATSTQFF